MSTASSAAFSLWTILSVLFLIFLVHHLWCYDRFKCLRWTAGRQPGAFKRVMTYSYLCAVPLFTVYSVGMTVIKVREGFIVVPPDGPIIPAPINLYTPSNRNWVLPLQFVFSFAWALEQVTHLEELAFWLYLLHQNPNKAAWFSSWEYRLWYTGSLAAIIGLPLTALITRHDLVTCDAYIFLVGSAGSLSITIAFLYVLWRFPRFIKHVKAEGADPSVVVRLATFYQLNQVRVVFRFLFTLPLLILALDGIIGTSHSINRDLFITDFLQELAGIGCFVSSMITLLIFFPRSIVREAGYKPKPASSIAPTSPKSPAITPAPHSPPPPHHHHLPAHVVAYAHGTGGVMRMSAAGYTTTTGATWEGDGSAYTPSAYSPRESLYDSPMYTSEEGGGGDGDVQRRRSRTSRRASAYSRKRHEDDYGLEEEDEGEEGADAEGEGPGKGVVVSEEDWEEERVPPYSHEHPHPHPHAHLVHPSPAHLHFRNPFPHANSSPQLAPPTPPPADTPNPKAKAKEKAKRRTWDWQREERYAGTGTHQLARPRSMHVIVGAPPHGAGGGVGGVNLVNLNPGLGAAVVSQTRGSGRPGSSLHPYVVNFTSPIDLVDLPPHEQIPLPPHA